MVQNKFQKLLNRSCNARILIGLLLVFIIIAAYWQVNTFDFTNFDDHLHITNNPYVRSGLSDENAVWAFHLSDRTKSYWHPLTWLSHMLDVELYGMDAGRHHLTNVLFHIANTLLLFWVLHRMTGALWRSALVAGLFAVHPLNVESVAWIAERKNVLSTFLGMLTVLLYSYYTDRPTVIRYGALVFVFALGLLAKPMLVTLPFVLMLLDYWPLNRITNQTANAVGIKFPRQLILEKLPLLLLSGLSVVLSSLSVQNQNIAISFDAVPLQLRIANALVSYVRYVAKMIWPHNLAVYYPYPDSIPLWQGAASAVFLIGVSILVLRVFKRRPYLALGWFWYLGTLIPVSGLVQAGLWPAIADRWAYVPLIGLFIMIVWGGADLLRRWRDKALSLAIAVGAILICLLVSARIQAGYWADSVTLFQRALAVTGSTWIAHNNLGNALAVQGKLAEAIRHFHLSLQNNPPYPEEVYYNLASTLVSQGKLAEAIKIYAKALELNPDFVAAHINLGSAYAQHGKIIKAINHYSEALRLAPNSAEAHLNMGNGLLAQQRADEAIDHFYRAVQLDSNRAESHNALGLALLRKGKIEDAIFHFQTAYELKPYFKAAHLNLTLALSNNEKLKQAAENMQKALNFKLADPDLKTKIKDLLEKKKALDQAINRFQKSLFRQPGFTEIDTEDLSIVSETKKRYDGKLDLFRKIIEQLPDNAEAYYHLACIYARQGKIVESIKWLDKAISSGFNRWDLIETDSDLDYIRKSSHYSKWVKS